MSQQPCYLFVTTVDAPKALIRAHSAVKLHVQGEGRGEKRRGLKHTVMERELTLGERHITQHKDGVL